MYLFLNKSLVLTRVLPIGRAIFKIHLSTPVGCGQLARPNSEYAGLKLLSRLRKHTHGTCVDHMQPGAGRRSRPARSSLGSTEYALCIRITCSKMNLGKTVCSCVGGGGRILCRERYSSATANCMVRPPGCISRQTAPQAHHSHLLRFTRRSLEPSVYP